MVTTGLFFLKSGPKSKFHSLRVMGVTSDADRGVLGPRLVALFAPESGGPDDCLRIRTARTGDFRAFLNSFFSATAVTVTVLVGLRDFMGLVGLVSWNFGAGVDAGVVVLVVVAVDVGGTTMPSCLYCFL